MTPTHEPRAGRDKPATSLNSPGGGALFASAGAFLPLSAGRVTPCLPSADAQEVRPRASGGDTAHKYKNGRVTLEPDTASPQPGGTTARTACRAEYRDGGGCGDVSLRHSLTPTKSRRGGQSAHLLSWNSPGRRTLAGGFF